MDDFQEKRMYRAHPWHGLSLRENNSNTINCYIEIVSTDTVKYELDKETGILKIDRPQKFSSLCPSLYGLLPQTYCGPLIAEHCMKKTGRKNISGDGDPLDICVFTERAIPRGDIILKAHPIGGFRLIDNDQADDKIIAYLEGDFLFEKINDIKDAPEKLIDRLKHYFLSYKDIPGKSNHTVVITDTFDKKEALEIISLAEKDYQNLFS